MNRQEKQDMMLNAPIPGIIVRMAIPTIISMLVTSVYNMADTFFIGKMNSVSATASIGIAFPLMSIIQAIGFFFGHGSGNAISRHLGANNGESATVLASCGFYTALFSGFAIMILGEAFLEPIARMLGSTETILPYAKEYLSIIFIGAPYMTAAFVLNNQMRFQGSAFYSMVGIASGGILNIFLDPLFIFKFGMGVTGAALATIISQFVSFVLLLIGIKRSGCVSFKIKHLKKLPLQIGEICRGGLPSLCRQGLASVANACLNIAAKPFGDAAIAAMTVVSRITMFANSAMIGFGQGFQPVCGFNYGAKNRKRVEEAFWFSVKVITASLIVVAFLGIVFSGSLVYMFNHDTEVVRIGTLALTLQCIVMPLNGWVTINNMMFQTCGRTWPATILASARQGLFFAPAVLILPLFLGILGIQSSQMIADAATFLTALYLNKKYMPRMFNGWETDKCEICEKTE